MLLAGRFNFDANGGAIGESQRLADTQAYAENLGKIIQNALYNHVAQRFHQMDMRARAFFDNRFAQLAVVQYAANIMVIDLLVNAHVDIGINMQGLGGAQFVLQDANAGIQREPGEKDTASGHVKSVKEAPEKSGFYSGCYCSVLG